MDNWKGGHEDHVVVVLEYKESCSLKKALSAVLEQAALSDLVENHEASKSDKRAGSLEARHEVGITFAQMALEGMVFHSNDLTRCQNQDAVDPGSYHDQTTSIVDFVGFADDSSVD